MQPFRILFGREDQELLSKLPCAFYWTFLPVVFQLVSLERLAFQRSRSKLLAATHRTTQSRRCDSDKSDHQRWNTIEDDANVISTRCDQFSTERTHKTTKVNISSDSQALTEQPTCRRWADWCNLSGGMHHLHFDSIDSLLSPCKSKIQKTEI